MDTRQPIKATGATGPTGLIAQAINTSAPTIQTDSGRFGNEAGRIATNSENSPLTGTIQ